MTSLTKTAAAAFIFSAATAMAQSSESGSDSEVAPERGDPAAFSEEGYTTTEGEAVYNTLCAGCHMPDGSGAAGAGAYPALENNQNLQAAGYSIYLILNGQRGMPSMGHLLNDEQIAAVTNYIQTHFGNDYAGDATAEMVQQSRPQETGSATAEEDE